jgi:phage FluMu protein Com
MDDSFFKEYRCDCGKLLFKGSLAVATIEIKCKRCEKINLFEENLSQKIPTPLVIGIDGVELAKPDKSNL